MLFRIKSHRKMHAMDKNRDSLAENCADLTHLQTDSARMPSCEWIVSTTGLNL